MLMNHRHAAFGLGENFPIATTFDIIIINILTRCDTQGHAQCSILDFELSIVHPGHKIEMVPRIMEGLEAVADLSPWSRDGKSPTICDRSELDDVPGIDQCSNRALDLVHPTAEEPYVRSIIHNAIVSVQPAPSLFNGW